ncbi:MAG: PorV/PorQ family protein [Flexibacteraceae bacterium]
MKKFYKAVLLLSASVLSFNAIAGNDTKRGQGGATELLVNPWARTSGMANSILAGVNGVEAMNLNVAGTSYTTGTEVMFASTRYLSGSDIRITALGLTSRVSETGVMGISFTGWNLGDFIETRFDQPEGTGATFSPNIFNIGMSYSQMFSEKITGGLLLRGLFQSIPNASASNVAIDAGVQYRSGDKKQFKIGVSLRNVGPRMIYRGDGFAATARIQDPDNQVEQSTAQPFVNSFEMPATLSIGTSYDFYINTQNRLTLAGTFQSNSYTQDEYNFGLEYGFNDLFMLRTGFNGQNNVFSETERTSLNTGLTAGFSVKAPLDQIFTKENGGELEGTEAADATKPKKRFFTIDYSFRSSNPYNGTHSVGLSFNF